MPTLFDWEHWEPVDDGAGGQKWSKNGEGPNEPAQIVNTIKSMDDKMDYHRIDGEWYRVEKLTLRPGELPAGAVGE
jgi:hypothetical protein